MGGTSVSDNWRDRVGGLYVIRADTDSRRAMFGGWGEGCSDDRVEEGSHLDAAAVLRVEVRHISHQTRHGRTVVA